MKAMKNKIRYSFPGRIYDLLLTDNKFLHEVSKIRTTEMSFPRYDQWRDEHGFHVSFALAGYSPSDLSLSVMGRQISLSSDGLMKITSVESVGSEEEGDTEDKVLQTSVHKGYVGRGIARRSFKTQLYISEEFNLDCIEAKMEHGLLHIFVPELTTKLEEIKVEIN